MISPLNVPISTPGALETAQTAGVRTAERIAAGSDENDQKLRETFGQFVGETFFHQLIKSMRSSLGRPAYFHGGRAEEVFQGQLDQILSERVAESSSAEFAEPMFELFQLQRRG